jgi:hypothetical protein
MIGTISVIGSILAALLKIMGAFGRFVGGIF